LKNRQPRPSNQFNGSHWFFPLTNPQITHPNRYECQKISVLTSLTIKSPVDSSYPMFHIIRFQHFSSHNKLLNKTSINKKEKTIWAIKKNHNLECMFINPNYWPEKFMVGPMSRNQESLALISTILTLSGSWLRAFSHWYHKPNQIT